jgi:hypothetical protein
VICSSLLSIAAGLGGWNAGCYVARESRVLTLGYPAVTTEGTPHMRTRLLLTGLAAASLLVAGLTAASPAYATSNTAGVSSGSANQYLQVPGR